MIHCPNCNKGFTRPESLTYHINNNACKEKRYQCKHCESKFTSKSNMYRHMKHWCNSKLVKEKQDKDEIEVLKDELVKLRSELNDRKDLEKRFTKMEKQLKNKQVVSKQTNNANSINNGTIINNDNRVTNNITIVAYGKEDMSQIDRDDIIKALKTGFNSTKQLTEIVHFNPKYPSYSNIKRSNFNMKNKVMYHDGENWITTTDPHMIDDLYNRKRDFIEENIEDYYDGLNPADLKKLNRWLGVDDDDRRITKIKGELREILFNKKDVSEQNEKQLASYQIRRDEPVTEQGSSSLEPMTPTINDVDSENTLILVKARTTSSKNDKKVAHRNGKYRKKITGRLVPKF